MVESLARILAGIGFVHLTDDQLKKSGGRLIVDDFDPIGFHHFLAILFSVANETKFSYELV
jgi:hypothetical protein